GDAASWCLPGVEFACRTAFADSPAVQIIITDAEKKPRQVETAATRRHGPRGADARRALRQGIRLRLDLRGAGGRGRRGLRARLRCPVRTLLDRRDGWGGRGFDLPGA